MSTAEELEQFKEPGKFELLATAVLCKAQREYRAILHTGMNAQGQPIKSPVDGFCRVPESIPLRFVLVEHTVERNLEQKWLFDHRTVQPSAKGRKKQLSASDDGDLLKAGHLAESIKTQFPDAKFTVVLTTNQGLKPDLCLKVEKKAEELGISIDFWDRSRIARFLDTEPEGQWLRKEYLGIAAEMLSDALLRDLCHKSLDEYQKQFITNPDQWVSRQVDQQVEKGINNQSCSIQLLIGNSGSGKSATAYQMAKKYLDAGGYSLWLSENILTASDSFTNALDKALHDLYPSLMPDSGREALRLLKSGERILLIADDVNRTDNPVKLLQKLVNWSKPISSSKPDAKPVPLQHLLVCPVWSDVVRSITPEFDKTNWINSVFIGVMVLEEGAKAVKDVAALTAPGLTNTEATALAEKMGNDPILIGLFTSLLADTQPHEWSYLAENVVDSFITKAINEVSQTGSLLSDEYNSALLNLAVQMLQHRKLNPLLTDIKSWFVNASEDMNALRALLRDGKLCRIDDGKLVFRHDRLREALMVKSMGELLNSYTEPLDIFWEPYYAEIIGQAIVQYPQCEEFLEELCAKLPLSLLESIRYFTIPSNQYHQAIYRKLQDWVDSEVSSGLVPESVLGTFCWKLIEIDSPLIIKITEQLTKYRPVLLSRIRNGCTISGVQFCILENQFYFAPFEIDSFRDKALEQAKYYHKEKILEELKQILNSSNINDEYRAGALTFAGFLEFFELKNEILICWRLIDNKAQFLPHAIWAASQCCGDDPQRLLDPLIEFWAELPDQENDYGVSWKNRFINELSGSLPRYIRSHVLDYFVSQADKYESLRQHIVHICQRIDSPNAVEFVVKSMAKIERGLTGTQGVLGWIPKDINLSKKSSECLFYLFNNPDSDNFIKQNISQLLPVDLEPIPIGELREKYPNSFIFYNAIQKYIKLGDFRFLPDLLRLLPIDCHWFYVAHGLWCNEIQTITQNYLESFQNDIPQALFKQYLSPHKAVANCLTKIPLEDAEYLLEKYWKFLGFSVLFIQTALYIGTPKTLTLVDESLKKFCNNTLVFKHLFRGLNDYSCKFLYKGWTISSGDVLFNLAPEKLEILSPYIDYFDEYTLWNLADTCQRVKKVEWGRKFLINKLDEQKRRQFYPSEQELLADLDKYEAQDDGQILVNFWLDEFDKRHEPKTNALRLIDSWLALNPNLKRFEITAACISNIGTRQNNALLILDKYQIEGLPDEIERIKASTRFAIYRRTLD